MNHEQAERLLSARIDGERLTTRASASLEQHLETCVECRAFERAAYRLREAARFQVAPAVPDLVEQVMTAVGAEAERPRARLRVVRPGGSPRGSILPRLAPVAAALIVGALIGSLVVGDPGSGPRPVRRSPPPRSPKASRPPPPGSTYQATFAIDERHLSPEVPERHLTMRVSFEAPERFRLDVVDHTDYPMAATPSLKLVVDGSMVRGGPGAVPGGDLPPARVRRAQPPAVLDRRADPDRPGAPDLDARRRRPADGAWSRHGARPAGRARRGPVRTRRAAVPLPVDRR